MALDAQGKRQVVEASSADYRSLGIAHRDSRALVSAAVRMRTCEELVDVLDDPEAPVPADAED